MSASAVFLICGKDMWAQWLIKASYKTNPERIKNAPAFCKKTNIYVGLYLKKCKNTKDRSMSVLFLLQYKTQFPAHATVASIWKNKMKIIAKKSFRGASHSCKCVFTVAPGRLKPTTFFIAYLDGPLQMEFRRPHCWTAAAGFQGLQREQWLWQEPSRAHSCPSRQHILQAVARLLLNPGCSVHMLSIWNRKVRKLKSLGSRGAQGAPSCEQDGGVSEIGTSAEKLWTLTEWEKKGWKASLYRLRLGSSLSNPPGKRILERTVPWGLGNGHQRKWFF